MYIYIYTCILKCIYVYRYVLALRWYVIEFNLESMCACVCLCMLQYINIFVYMYMYITRARQQSFGPQSYRSISDQNSNPLKYISRPLWM